LQLKFCFLFINFITKLAVEVANRILSGTPSILYFFKSARSRGNIFLKFLDILVVPVIFCESLNFSCFGAERKSTTIQGY